MQLAACARYTKLAVPGTPRESCSAADTTSGGCSPRWQYRYRCDAVCSTENHHREHRYTGILTHEHRSTGIVQCTGVASTIADDVGTGTRFVFCDVAGASPSRVHAQFRDGKRACERM